MTGWKRNAWRRRAVIGAVLPALLGAAACAGPAGPAPLPSGAPSLPAPLPVTVVATADTGTPAVVATIGPMPTDMLTTPLTTSTAAPSGTSVANGCPAQTAPADASPPIDVSLSGQNGSASLAVGQGLEVVLSAKNRWSMAALSPAGVLAPANPNGWYDPARQACLWRFTARTPGTLTLTFAGGALCPPGSLCPQFVIAVSFKITVKGLETSWKNKEEPSRAEQLPARFEIHPPK